MFYLGKSTRKDLAVLAMFCLSLASYGCSRSAKKTPTKKAATADAGGLDQELPDLDQAPNDTPLGDEPGVTTPAPGTNNPTTSSGGSNNGGTGGNSGGNNGGGAGGNNGGGANGKKASAGVSIAKDSSTSKESLKIKWSNKTGITNGAKYQYQTEWKGTSEKGLTVSFKPKVTLSYKNSSSKECTITVKDVATKAQEAAAICKK